MSVTDIARQVFSTVFVAIVSAVFAISFAAIIYNGDLAPFFNRGIGLTLMGGAIVAVIGAVTLSYRGSIVQPQDAPAILIAGGSASLIASHGLSGEALFATVACIVALSSLLTGVVALLVGQLRLAMFARYIPYPVLAGFLAATGLLLLMGGVSVAVEATPSFDTLALFGTAEAVIKWGSVCLAAIVIVWATRVFTGQLTLPIALIAVTIAFYVIILAQGLSLEDAQAAGFILGPFQQGSFLTGIDGDTLAQADWNAIVTQVPVIATIVAISLIGATLNASGLELEVGRDLDIDRDMRGVGVANIVSACAGGLPSYHLLGETVLAHRLGLVGVLAGFSSAVGCLAVLLLGGAALSVMPTGLFATIIAYLGVDLLYTWLWKERQNFRAADYFIVLLIPLIAITYSFLAAIALGLFLAFCLFVIAYAKLDVFRSQTTLATRRSFVERPDTQLQQLADLGQNVQIVELSGYLFFASAHMVRERIKVLLQETAQPPHWLVLDFRHVSGLDSSTWHMMQKLADDCDAQGVQVVFCNIARLEAGGRQTGLRPSKALAFDTLDLALEHVEDVLLSRAPVVDLPASGDIWRDISAVFPDGALAQFTETITASAGDVVIKRGAQSSYVYVLTEGQLSVSVPNQDGSTSTVAQIRSGFLIGEIAYYAGGVRSADVIAKGDVTLHRIDMQRLDAAEEQLPRAVAEVHKIIARHMASRLSRTTQLLRDLGATSS